jgi:hypothetical protein
MSAFLLINLLFLFLFTVLSLASVQTMFFLIILILCHYHFLRMLQNILNSTWRLLIIYLKLLFCTQQHSLGGGGGRNLLYFLRKMFDVSEFHLVPSTKCLMVMTQGSHPVWSFDISLKCFKINLSGKICCNK